MSSERMRRKLKRIIEFLDIFKVKVQKKISAIDLFCGIGGMTHGFILEGIKVVAGIDADSSCRYAFKVNNKAKFIEKKIEDIKGEELISLYPENNIKILIGCAPCQPFSKYTSKKPKDEKWGLLYEFSRLVREVEPEIVSMENVPGLATRPQHYVFDNFVEALESNNYKISFFIVYCPDYGIPQTRTRLVLFASKFGKIELINNTHNPDEYIKVCDIIEYLPPIKDGDIDANDPLHSARRLSELNKKRIRASIPGGTWRDWDDDLKLSCHKKSTGKHYASVYGRMRWDELSPTITTQAYGYGNGRFGHPDQDRAISLREASLLQAFPPDYKFINPSRKFSMKEIGRHIGNAVPPRLGQIIARSIIKHLEINNV